MQKIFISILMLGFTLMACNSHETKPIKLDNGEKWTANAETTEGIKNMQVLMSKSAISADELEDQMKNEFNLIFKNCTMKGEAHNQLHNYLLPLKSRLDKLSENSEAQKTEVQAYLDSYFTYFK